MNRPMILLRLLFLAAVLVLSGCGTSRERTTYDPGHRHAEEVGELKLPAGQ